MNLYVPSSICLIYTSTLKILTDIFVVYGDDPGGECLVHPRRSCEDGIIVNQQGVQDEHNFYGTTPNITSVSGYIFAIAIY